MKIYYTTVSEDILKARQDADTHGKTIDHIQLTDTEIGNLWSELRYHTMLPCCSRYSLDEFTASIDTGKTVLYGVKLTSRRR